MQLASLNSVNGSFLFLVVRVLQDVGLRAAEVKWLRRRELRDDPTIGFTSGVSDSIGRSLLKTTGESRGDEVKAGDGVRSGPSTYWLY